MALRTFRISGVLIIAGLLTAFLFSSKLIAATCLVLINYATIQSAVDAPACDTPSAVEFTMEKPFSCG